MKTDVKMGNDKDVGFMQDFMFFLQNAIACEHHCQESYALNKDPYQLELAIMIRRIRSKWMYRFIKESKNQIYCENKHLMGMAAASKEMGNRFIESNEKKLAEECFEESQLYESVFILLNS